MDGDSDGDDPDALLTTCTGSAGDAIKGSAEFPRVGVYIHSRSFFSGRDHTHPHPTLTTGRMFGQFTLGTLDEKLVPVTHA